MKEIFEWERIFFNTLPGEFMLEVVLRSTIMFVILLVVLRVAGKRGVKQLSIFETVIIISLGSAAGDPMFYEDVGLFPAITVFVTIILLYRLVTWLTGKFKWFETIIEGKTVCLIHDGKFSINEFKKESLAQDEFFSELRLKSVEHLGQIRNAYLESSGEVSIFYFEDDQVKPGLPILPERFNLKSKVIKKPGTYSCSFCGNTVEQDSSAAVCTVCAKDEWVEAIHSTRIT